MKKKIEKKKIGDIYTFFLAQPKKYKYPGNLFFFFFLAVVQLLLSTLKSFALVQLFQ